MQDLTQAIKQELHNLSAQANAKNPAEDIYLRAHRLPEKLLLRSCQFGIVIGGILLILIGSGVRTDWLHPLAFITVTGSIFGLIYENRRQQRGEGDGMIAVLLPLAGVLSGAFALLATV